MALKRNAKTGAIEWDEDQEEQIEMSREARVRSARQLAADTQAKACKRGTHDEDGSGKCAACGVEVKKSLPEDEPKPKAKHLLTM
jgi:hypothetical protein